MTIQNARELQSVLREVVITLDKLIFARVKDEKLDTARRQLNMVADRLKRGEALTDAQLKSLEMTAETLRQEIADERIGDLLWDITDYLELHGSS